MMRRLWESWKRLARVIGNLQARLFLILFYFTVMLPFGLLVRLRSDPLQTQRPPTSWLDYPGNLPDMTWARRQW
jgi:hypothetical protein